MYGFIRQKNNGVCMGRTCMEAQIWLRACSVDSLTTHVAALDQLCSESNAQESTTYMKPGSQLIGKHLSDLASSAL